MSLSFSKASSSQEIQNILDYNINAFVDSPGFTWDLMGIKREIDTGWDLYGVQFEKEIIIIDDCCPEKSGFIALLLSLRQFLYPSRL